MIRVSHGPQLDKLFEMIDDGYCLCEMIRDADGRAVDYRFLETNSQFERMTGLSNVRHRTARELVPGLEQAWVDTYDRVARGEPKLGPDGQPLPEETGAADGAKGKGKSGKKPAT